MKETEYQQRPWLKLAVSILGAFLLVVHESRAFLFPISLSSSRSSLVVVGSQKRSCTSSLLMATKAPTDITEAIMKREYSDQELKDALESILKDSNNPDYDGRHIFGYGNENHKLSMLQIITATRMLDYREMMVRTK